MIETNIHGKNSRIMRGNPASESYILSELIIPGYDIIFPETCKHFQQARIMLYVRSTISYTIIPLNRSKYDLPIITVKVSPNEIISFVYREYTGRVSGLGTEGEQMERLGRIICHWERLGMMYKDLTIIGDLNIDERRILDRNYQKNIVSMMLDYRTRSGMRQLVEQDTRQQVVGGKSSMIDHVYNGEKRLVKEIKLNQITTSDHQGSG